MNYWTLPAAILILGVGLTACERESKTVEKSTGTTVVQPKETTKEKETVVTTPGPTGPAGPAGAPGEKGEPGKSASDTASPSSDTTKESSTETKTETTTETKKE